MNLSKTEFEIENCGHSKGEFWKVGRCGSSDKSILTIPFFI